MLCFYFLTPWQFAMLFKLDILKKFSLSNFIPVCKQRAFFKEI